jgi:hypothetical protein
MVRKFYLPDYHNFEYLATVRWPLIESGQQDWIFSLEELEQWLEQFSGPRYAAWAWSQCKNQQPYECSVAFKWDQHRTLFLLKWTA